MTGSMLTLACGVVSTAALLVVASGPVFGPTVGRSAIGETARQMLDISRSAGAASSHVHREKRLILVSGVGSSARTASTTARRSDVMSQCRDAWASIQQLLAREGASVQDIVRIELHIADSRLSQESLACSNRIFADGAAPEIRLNVAALAMPAMLIEVAVTAALANSNAEGALK